MSGRNQFISCGRFEKLFNDQMAFQERIEDISPSDDPVKFHYHITALQEEIGEVLKADKRWKTHRNTSYDPNEKMDEIADCFITLINISGWSGFSVEQILNGIENKIVVNNKRLDKKGENS